MKPIQNNFRFWATLGIAFFATFGGSNSTVAQTTPPSPPNAINPPSANNPGGSHHGIVPVDNDPTHPNKPRVYRLHKPPTQNTEVLMPSHYYRHRIMPNPTLKAKHHHKHLRHPKHPIHPMHPMHPEHPMR